MKNMLIILLVKIIKPTYYSYKMLFYSNALVFSVYLKVFSFKM